MESRRGQGEQNPFDEGMVLSEESSDQSDTSSEDSDDSANKDNKDRTPRIYQSG